MLRFHLGADGNSIGICKIISASVLLLLLPTHLGAADLFVPKYDAVSAPLIIGLLALGVLLGLLGYTIFLAVSTKEPMFIYFSIIMVLLTILQSFAAFDRLVFTLTYNRVTVITHLLFITFLLFFEDFFSLSEHAPALSRFNRVSLYVIALYTVFFLLVKLLFPGMTAFIATVDFIRELFVFYTNILFLYTIGRAIAWMRLEAMLILIAFIPPAVLTSVNAMNIFPFMQRHEQLVIFLMTYNQPIGLSLQAILFSLAMGNRYNRIKLERQEASQESERLRELDAQKTEFFMNMSHELRTPLTIILGMTQQLRHGKFGDSIQANDRILQTVERNGLRLLRQVNHLLRIGKPHETLESEPLAIGLLLQRMVQEFSPIARDRGITLSLRSDSPQVIRLPAEDFEAVVMNLISNALKFTEAGGSVTVDTALADDGALHITIEDTGIGIDKSEQDAVFLRYHHGHGVTDQAQSGLGLPLVKSIMEGLGGSVLLASEPGKGSIFTLVFPASLVCLESTTASDRTGLKNGHLYTAEFTVVQDPLVCEQDKKKPTVLVIDDNRDMCAFICAAIGSEYRVLVAHSGAEGLRILDEKPVELIISDIMMPHMDGHAFLSAIRERERLTPLIFLTARDSLEEKIQSLREGALNYLTKPFSAQMLLATIQATLSHDHDLIGSNIERLRRGFDELLDQLRHPALTHREVIQDSAIDRFVKSHGLSARERDILTYLLNGKSDKEIASELDLSVKTVANHNRRLYRKVGVNSRFELVSKLFGDIAN